MQEVGALVTLHEPEKMLIQDSNVSFSIHLDIGWQEEDPSSSPSSRERTPHHH